MEHALQSNLRHHKCTFSRPTTGGLRHHTCIGSRPTDCTTGGPTHQTHKQARLGLYGSEYFSKTFQDKHYIPTELVWSVQHSRFLHVDCNVRQFNTGEKSRTHQLVFLSTALASLPLCLGNIWHWVRACPPPSLPPSFPLSLPLSILSLPSPLSPPLFFYSLFLFSPSPLSPPSSPSLHFLPTFSPSLYTSISSLLSSLPSLHVPPFPPLPTSPPSPSYFSPSPPSLSFLHPLSSLPISPPSPSYFSPSPPYFHFLSMSPPSPPYLPLSLLHLPSSAT